MQREAALEMLADGLVGACSAAVARVWTLGPGDICGECPMRSECPDQTQCLHLVKSAGVSTRIDGAFRRFPLGAREVGRVSQTLEPFVLNDDVARLGVADATWLMVHDVRGFAVVPLVYEGQCIGVAAVFAKDLITGERLATLQALAAFATGIIVGAATSRPATLPPVMPKVKPVPRQQQPSIQFLRPLEATERDVIERVLDHTHGRVS